jgi:cation diffusion facilitator family transporter
VLYSDCARCGRITPKASVIVNFSSAAFKSIVGFITGSKGLVADGIHSSADAISSCLILISLKISGKEEDHNHHYGHGKIEYVTSLTAGIFLFLGAASIFISSIESFAHGTHEIPGNMAIVATIISIATSYLMYDSSYCAGTQINSPALIADALESRADSISAVAVLLGLIGTRVGIYFADSLAAMIVSILIFRMSLQMFGNSFHGLMDNSMDDEVLEGIRKNISKIKGVKEITYIKSRSVGQKNRVDIGLKISSRKTVDEAHDITEYIRDTIMRDNKSVGNVSVYYSYYRYGLFTKFIERQGLG